MREYLFRGIDEGTNKWVYGYYFEKPSDFGGEKRYYIFDNKTISKYNVIPETVGEWTGLVDNNGTKIFEGDIVRCQERYDRPYSDKRKSKRHIGVVEYKTRKGDKFYNHKTKEWDRHMEYGAEWIVNVRDYGKFVHGSWGDFWDCEVIGTVFENADLLEG